MCLTGCHWYTNTLSIWQPGIKKKKKKDLRWTMSVFPSRLSNRVSARGVRTKPNLTFHLHRNRFSLGTIKISCLFGMQRKHFMVRRADVHVFHVIALFRELFVGLKRQRAAAWKPKQNVQCSELFQSCGISALMYSACFVFVRVCVH